MPNQKQLEKINTKEHQDLMEDMINLATTVKQLEEKYEDCGEEIVEGINDILGSIENTYRNTYFDVYGQYPDHDDYAPYEKPWKPKEEA